MVVGLILWAPNPATLYRGFGADEIWPAHLMISYESFKGFTAYVAEYFMFKIMVEVGTATHH